MSVSFSKSQASRLGRNQWGELPERMRVLYITTERRTGSWLAEALAADSASQVELEEAEGAAAGLTRLSDEIFDAVLLCHESEQLDALMLIEGLRSAGNFVPIVVLGHQPVEELDAQCYEVGADGYLCVHTTTTRSLVWTIARAVQRGSLSHQCQQMAAVERQRIEAEKEDAARLLSQQQSLLDGFCGRARDIGNDVESTGAECQSSVPSDVGLNVSAFPDDLVKHYSELLRAHVIMGSGSLATELSDLAEALCSARMQPHQAVQLHLQVLRDTVRGLGNRSARHVMNRATVLALELLIQLAAGYRRRYLDRQLPPRQQSLPGLVEPTGDREARR